MLLERGDGAEGVTHRVLPTLLTCATMASQNLCAGSFKHLGVGYGTLNGRKDAELGSDGYGELSVERMDCGFIVSWLKYDNEMKINEDEMEDGKEPEGRLRRTKLVYKVPFIHEERAVVPTSRNLLRTPKVDVDSVAVRGYELCSS